MTSIAYAKKLGRQPSRRTERLRRHLPNPQDAPLIFGGVGAIAVVLMIFSILLGLAAIDVWTGIIVALVLLLVSFPAFQAVARVEDAPWMFKALYWGLVAKMIFSMLRFFMFFNIYNGNGDAGLYHDVGATFARRWRDGIPIHPLPRISAFPRETHWIGDITGSLYVVTGVSAYAGFLFFSYLCFWGQVLTIRGLHAAVPEVDLKRFTYLMLFMPSVLFWPSSIGKEAVMLFLLGFVFFGGGLLLGPRPQIRGIAYFAMGLGGLSMIRPHVALISVGALLIGSILAVFARGSTGDGSKSRLRALVPRLIGVIAVVGLATFTLGRFNERFGEDGSTDALTTLSATQASTSQGHSEFTPWVITSPLNLPKGVIGVLFRPFPWEAGSSNALIGAVEGLILTATFLFSLRRLKHFGSLLLRRPFLVFAMVFVLTFAMAFSYVGNFGILSRQRSQMIPLALVMVGLTPAASSFDWDRRRRRLSEMSSPERRTEVGNGHVDDTVGGRVADAIVLHGRG